MWITIAVLLVLTGMALISNYRNNDIYIFTVEWNKWNSPFFELGLSNRHWHDDNGTCVETYCLGLLFINVNVDFIQADEES